MKNRHIFTLSASAIMACAAWLPVLALDGARGGAYWNSSLRINSFRLPPPPPGAATEYLDLDCDGRYDAIKTVTHGDVPVLWLDDGGSGIREGDTEIAAVDACLLVDRNRDGRYDFVVKWLDDNGDGRADMQLVMEYPCEPTDQVWPNGHYMWVIDSQGDGIFNCIDWNTFKIEAWKRSGLSDFHLGYAGRKAFLKIHTSTDKMDDLRLNWENPFLFFDDDGDGLSERAVRFMVPRRRTGAEGAEPNTREYSQLATVCDWVSLAVDIDNDNAPGNEFDFDFSVAFMGPGFDYSGFSQKIKNRESMRGLPQADAFFPDPRFRNLEELVYPAHEDAWDCIFKMGKWNRFWFAYDEDDDCSRWERVEFYKPLDMFKVGTGKGGLDDNVQSDPSGDRGEWDDDGSGGGRLYVGAFDGRLHLLGAEWGAWRIDQDAEFFQGFNRTFQNRDPRRFATVKYSDTNSNGFFDTLEYDLDGDGKFEEKVSLAELGIDDRCDAIDMSGFNYSDVRKLGAEISEGMWKNALKAVAAAEECGLDTSWYAKLKTARSLREKYAKGWWLQFYIYKDLEDLLSRRGDSDGVARLRKAYYSGRWEDFLK